MLVEILLPISIENIDDLSARSLLNIVNSLSDCFNRVWIKNEIKIINVGRVEFLNECANYKISVSVQDKELSELTSKFKIICEEINSCKEILKFLEEEKDYQDKVMFNMNKTCFHFNLDF